MGNQPTPVAQTHPRFVLLVIASVVLSTIITDAVMSQLRPGCSVLSQTAQAVSAEGAKHRIKGVLGLGSVETVADIAYTRESSLEAPSAGYTPPDSYTLAARANLTTFKTELLSKQISIFDTPKVEGLWGTYSPIITCPPARPLTRYGGEGDGSTLLCKLPQLL